MSDRKVDSWIGAGTIVSTSLAPVDSGMVRDAGVAGASPPGGGRNQTRLSFPFPQFYPPCVGRRHDSLLARDGWMMAVCQSTTTVPSTTEQGCHIHHFHSSKNLVFSRKEKKVAMRMNMGELSCAICYTLKTSAKFLAGDWLGNSQMFQLVSQASGSSWISIGRIPDGSQGRAPTLSSVGWNTMVGPRDERNWLSCTFVWCVSGLFKVIFCSFLFPPLSPLPPLLSSNT